MLEELAPLLKWWLAYEQWITEKYGTAYRDYCHAEWKKVKSKPSWLPPNLDTNGQGTTRTTRSAGQTRNYKAA